MSARMSAAPMKVFYPSSSIRVSAPRMTWIRFALPYICRR
jgi:hypothetical protein